MEPGQDRPDALVQLREQRREDPAVQVRQVLEAFEVAVGRLERRVDRVVGHVEEEGLAGVPLDEVARLAREGVGQVLGLVHGLAAAHQRVVGVVVGLLRAHMRGPDRAAVRGGPAALAAVGQAQAAEPGDAPVPGPLRVGVPLVEEAVELVEPAPQGVIGGGAAEVPLADRGGGVTGRAEVLRQRALAGGQAHLRVGVHRADRVPLEAEARLLAPGEQARAGWRADGCGDVALREAHAFVRQPVQVRRRDLRAAVGPEFAVAKVIRDDQDHVGPRCRRGGGGRGEGQQQQREQTADGHCGVGEPEWRHSMLPRRNRSGVRSPAPTGPLTLPPADPD